MKNYVIFDTAVGSLNKGDDIIMHSCKKALTEILTNGFIVPIATHTPAFQWFQANKMNSLYTYLKNADLKFVCGTNLLYTNMLRPNPNWNINIFNSGAHKNSILLGVGSGINSKNVNFYTKHLYNKVLSKEFIHSTRDEKTKQFLEKLGFKAINTGCVTLWDLTPDVCDKIPTSKSDTVIFTITDYSKDLQHDQQLINILKKNYKHIFFWPQGADDYKYFQSLNVDHNNINILGTSIDAYSDFLTKMECDYIGTRLHGGIFAMKHGKRAIIITVDYRAREMSKNYNLNCIERFDINELNSLINSKIITNTNIDFERIKQWYSQFK